MLFSISHLKDKIRYLKNYLFLWTQGKYSLRSQKIFAAEAEIFLTPDRIFSNFRGYIFVTYGKIFATWGNIRDPSGYFVLFEEIFSGTKIRFAVWPVYVRDIIVNIRHLSKNICYLRGNIRYFMGKFCYLRRNIRYPRDKIFYLRSQILSYINYPSEKIR